MLPYSALGSGVTLTLTHRPAAAVLIPLLAWEPPYAAGVALKKLKKKKKKKNERRQCRLEGFTISQRFISLTMTENDFSGWKHMKYVKIHEFIRITFF